MREYRWTGLLRRDGGSILMIVFGILLAIEPDFASAALSAAAGWILIAAGVTALVAGFVGGLDLGSVIAGALLLAAGRWLHRNPLMIASVFGVLLGFLVLSQGWRAAMDASRARRRGGFWIPGTVLAAAELLVGLRLIGSPLSASRLMLRGAGVIMVICGICTLTARYTGRKRIRENSRIIDADE